MTTEIEFAKMSDGSQITKGDLVEQKANGIRLYVQKLEKENEDHILVYMGYRSPADEIFLENGVDITSEVNRVGIGHLKKVF